MLRILIMLHFNFKFCSTFSVGILSEKHMTAEVFNDFHEFAQPSRYVNYDEHYETEIVLNSNLMIPDFPHSISV